VAVVLLACAVAVGCPAKEGDGGMTADDSGGSSGAGDTVMPIDPMGPETDGST
jgi:hypothetical protein